MDKYIRLRGARTHNLKNIDLDLPRDKLIVVCAHVDQGAFCWMGTRLLTEMLCYCCISARKLAS